MNPMDDLECFARKRRGWWLAYCPEVGVTEGGMTLETAKRNLTVHIYDDGYAGREPAAPSLLTGLFWRFTRGKERFTIKRFRRET